MASTLPQAGSGPCLRCARCSPLRENAAWTEVAHVGDRAYAVYGHVRRRSLRVRRGDRVHRGQVIGEVGNLGNSTEPHLHFQIQDHVRVLVAAGLPVAFDGVSVDGRTVDVPARMEIATFASA